MSGIGAIFNRSGRPADRDAASRMARALKPHGPERQAIALVGPCALAHAHFVNVPQAIDEIQPVEGGGGGRLVAVFDGRLDNRDDLLAALGRHGSDAAAMSDSALAMATIEAWGNEAAIKRWVGEFATIVWNRQERTLFAAIDPLGHRGLNFHVTPDRFVIASAPKGVFAAGGIARELDEQKLADALGQLYHDAERSYFKDIARLTGGRCMTVTPDRLDIARYWDIGDVAPVRYKRDQDYVEAGREIFDTAVKAAMRAPGKVGAFMSGGLDSPSVAATALRFLPDDQDRLATFTWVPEAAWDGLSEWYCHGDETPFVEAMTAMHPEIEAHFVDAAGLGMYHKLDDYIDLAEAPARNALNMCWAHAIHERAASLGITTLLGGDMGNMTLTWDGADCFLHWLRHGNWLKLARELWLNANRTPRGAAGLAFRQIVKPYLPDILYKRWLSRHETITAMPAWQRYSFISPDYAREMDLPGRADRFGFDYFQTPQRDTRRYRVQILTTGLTSEGAATRQALRALHGVEARDPTSDLRVVEWCMGIPRDQYLGEGKQRWLIKRMMAGRVPDKILYNTSKGRQCVDWHARMTRDLPKLREDFQTVANDPATAGMIDTARLGTMLEDWPEKTVVDTKDDRRILMPVNIPATLAIGRFKRRVEGANS